MQVKFDEANDEKSYNKKDLYFIPDVTLKNNCSVLFIEFYKSHRVDFDKKKKLELIGENSTNVRFVNIFIEEKILLSNLS